MHGDTQGCKPPATARGRRCALRPALVCRGLGHRIEHGRAGQGREATRIGCPKAGVGLRQVPAPQDLSPSPFADSAVPVPLTQAWRRGAAQPLQLRPWRVWKGGFGAGGGSGGGPGGGAVSAAGPSSAPPGLSLSLLPPPAPGGARHGGAGARQARYGDVEIGEAWCGEVGWGGGDQGQGGLAGRETEKPRVAGPREEESCPGTWGPLDGERYEAG